MGWKVVYGFHHFWTCGCEKGSLFARFSCNLPVTWNLNIFRQKIFKNDTGLISFSISIDVPFRKLIPHSRVNLSMYRHSNNTILWPFCLYKRDFYIGKTTLWYWNMAWPAGHMMIKQHNNPKISLTALCHEITSPEASLHRIPVSLHELKWHFLIFFLWSSILKMLLFLGITDIHFHLASFLTTGYS